MEQEEKTKWCEKLDGFIFEWKLPDRLWVKFQYKLRFLQEWVVHKIKEKLR